MPTLLLIASQPLPTWPKEPALPLLLCFLPPALISLSLLIHCHPPHLGDRLHRHPHLGDRLYRHPPLFHTTRKLVEMLQISSNLRPLLARLLLQRYATLNRTRLPPTSHQNIPPSFYHPCSPSQAIMLQPPHFSPLTCIPLHHLPFATAIMKTLVLFAPH